MYAYGGFGALFAPMFMMLMYIAMIPLMIKLMTDMLPKLLQGLQIEGQVPTWKPSAKKPCKITPTGDGFVVEYHYCPSDPEHGAYIMYVIDECKGTPCDLLIEGESGTVKATIDAPIIIWTSKGCLDGSNYVIPEGNVKWHVEIGECFNPECMDKKQVYSGGCM